MNGILFQKIQKKLILELCTDVATLYVFCYMTGTNCINGNM